MLSVYVRRVHNYHGVINGPRILSQLWTRLTKRDIAQLIRALAPWLFLRIQIRPQISTHTSIIINQIVYNLYMWVECEQSQDFVEYVCTSVAIPHFISKQDVTKFQNPHILHKDRHQYSWIILYTSRYGQNAFIICLLRRYPLALQYTVFCNTLYQACATCGPRGDFLRPAAS